MINKKFNILDCTLRDGSYTIDFQFNAHDTAIIASALENAGIKFIEIGHGMGLNSSSAGKGEAAASDEEYMQAASEVIRHAKWGMFFIPGIGRYKDLDIAASYGMDFIRIGTNITDLQNAEEYVKYAKDLGLFVSCNLMKTYIVTSDKIGQYGTQCEKYGADIIYLVDSAGTMLPENIKEYCNTLQKEVNIPIGLHCHDNLALGMANALTAIECGAEMVDSTLQGLGRGGGNPATEILVTILKKKGIDLRINEKKLMTISEELIKPLKKEVGINSINIISGFAGFHSSYLPIVEKYSEKYSVDLRDLIIKLCQIEQANVTEELVERIAKQLAYENSIKSNINIIDLPKISSSKVGFSKNGASINQVARILAKECKSRSIKKGKLSVFNLVMSSKYIDQIKISRVIQEEFEYIICSAEGSKIAHFEEIIQGADGIIDIFLVDNTKREYLDFSISSKIKNKIHKSMFFEYNDSDVWVRNIFYQIDYLNKFNDIKYISIIGSTIEAIKLYKILKERAYTVTLIKPKKKFILNDELCSLLQKSNILVSFHHKKPIISYEILKNITPDIIIIDGSIGSIQPDAMTLIHSQNIRIIRPDMRAAIAGELAGLLGTYRINTQIMGKTIIAGIPVVAGGIIGNKGDLIVDSISNPSRVIGVADGLGKLIEDPKESEKYNILIEAVEKELLQRREIF